MLEKAFSIAYSIKMETFCSTEEIYLANVTPANLNLHFTLFQAAKIAFIYLQKYIYRRGNKTLSICCHLFRGLGELIRKNWYLIPCLTKQRGKYSFIFLLLKATVFLPIREKLWDVKANAKSIWSSFTMSFRDSWNQVSSCWKAYSRQRSPCPSAGLA